MDRGDADSDHLTITRRHQILPFCPFSASRNPSAPNHFAVEMPLIGLSDTLGVLRHNHIYRNVYGMYTGIVYYFSCFQHWYFFFFLNTYSILCNKIFSRNFPYSLSVNTEHSDSNNKKKKMTSTRDTETMKSTVAKRPISPVDPPTAFEMEQ